MFYLSILFPGVSPAASKHARPFVLLFRAPSLAARRSKRSDRRSVGSEHGCDKWHHPIGPSHGSRDGSSSSSIPKESNIGDGGSSTKRG